MRILADLTHEVATIRKKLDFIATHRALAA
jgi:hypothetical protein